MLVGAGGGDQHAAYLGPRPDRRRPVLQHRHLRRGRDVVTRAAGLRHHRRRRRRRRHDRRLPAADEHPQRRPGRRPRSPRLLGTDLTDSSDLALAAGPDQRPGAGAVPRRGTHPGPARRHRRSPTSPRRPPARSSPAPSRVSSSACSPVATASSGSVSNRWTRQRPSVAARDRRPRPAPRRPVGQAVLTADVDEATARGACIQAAAVASGQPVTAVRDAWAPPTTGVAEPRQFPAAAWRHLPAGRGRHRAAIDDGRRSRPARRRSGDASRAVARRLPRSPSAASVYAAPRTAPGGRRRTLARRPALDVHVDVMVGPDGDHRGCESGRAADDPRRRRPPPGSDLHLIGSERLRRRRAATRILALQPGRRLPADGIAFTPARHTAIRTPVERLRGTGVQDWRTCLPPTPPPTSPTRPDGVLVMLIEPGTTERCRPRRSARHRSATSPGTDRWPSTAASPTRSRRCAPPPASTRWSSAGPCSASPRPQAHQAAAPMSAPSPIPTAPKGTA